MTGRSSENELHQVLWADACLEGIEIGYDEVVLRIRESTGRPLAVHAIGYIGYESCGVWDEAIVERAEFLLDHVSIRNCIDELTRRLGPNFPETGSPSRNSKAWGALRVHFVDGSVLTVVAARLAVRERAVP